VVATGSHESQNFCVFSSDGVFGNHTDLRTAMEWLGHTDTASTLRYLRPAEGKEAQAKMDAVFS
jgi:hypothetical protein